MVIRHYLTNANMDLMYGLQHFANLLCLGDKKKREFL
jgi:hypothetical protein